jgi:hypothetical protein
MSAPEPGQEYVSRRTGRWFRVRQVDAKNGLAQLEETREPSTACPLRWVSFDELSAKYVLQLTLGGGVLNEKDPS